MRAVLLILCACWFVVTSSRASDQADVTFLSDDDDDRKPLQTFVPDYPELARRERVEGEVQVCFNVRRDGRTHRVRVRNSTNRIFEKPSIRAVRASTYVPLAAGEPLPGIKTCRTFRFHLLPVEIDELS